MSLNIKNEHVHALAREAADRTGRSLTGAIELALEQLLATLNSGHRLDDLIAELQTEIAANGGMTSHEDLYDEVGLPR